MLKREKTGKFGLLVGKALAVASVLLIVLSSLFFVGQQKTEVAQAATTDTLNFQGRLLAAAGNLVDDGIYNMEFSIYYVSSGGSAVWTEDRLVTNTQGVTIKNGYFSVNLGEYDNFGGSINWGNDLYLGMTVRGTSNCAWGACTPADSEMTPRLKLTSVPYAFKAGNVGSNDTNSASTDSKDVSITTGNAAGSTSNSGDITIDVGTATQTAGTISIGTANTSGVTIGRTGVTTTNSGNLLVVGTSTLQGTATFSGVGTDITTGTNEDLTLLANGTGQIILNDTTQIATLGSADTDTLLCRNSSNQFATCTSTFDSSVTLQDAYTNSSSPATITTSDNKNIVFSLADTTTDADFIVDILGTGNTFEIRDGGTAVLTVADGAAVDITGTLDVSGRAAFGANASIASDSIVNVNQDSTVTSGFDYGVRGQLQVNPGSASTGTHVGIAASAVSKSGNSQNIGALAGLSGSARTEGTGTVTDLQGFYSLTYTLSGNATNLYGYHSDALVLGSTSVTNIYGFHSGITHNSSGNTTNAYGAYIDTATDVGSGSITNNYGILVAPQTAGTNDYGIRVDAADTQTLWLSGNADNTTAAAGIAFGASRDTNLYRSAANTLRTDDSLIVGTGLQVVTGDVSISAGALNTNGTQRLSNAGALSNITGYSQSSGNFLQSGAGTFGTGTGAVSLNGATSVTGSNTFTVGTGLSTFGGSVTITGSQFTNQGSTLNSAQAVADLPSGGNIGTAAATVDVNTTFDINQTTASQTITLPTPTDTTSGRIVYVNNVGSASFTMYGSVISAGKSNAFIWNGSTWVTTVSLSGSVVNAIGTIDSQTKSADGAVISTSAIYLQTADATYPGLVSTGTQTFAGNKTFNGDVTLASGAQLFIDDGDVSNLGLAFGTDTNTGLYNLGTDQIGLVAGGTTVAVVSNLSGNPQFMISDGTNSYPGLAFGSDEDTGIYSVAANELGITVGGSNILTASASSISFNGLTTDITTGTNEDLTVVANGTGQIILNDTVQVGSLASADTDTVLCRNSSNQVATCSSTFTSSSLQNAYVGGNTITATNAEGDIDLTVSEATNFSVDITGTGNFYVQDGGTNILTVADGGATTISNPSGTDVALTVNGGTSTGNILNVQDNGSTVFAISDGGNVGIGDSTPDYRLDVEYSSTSTTTTTEYNSYFTTTDTGVTTSGIDLTYGIYSSLTRSGATGGSTFGIAINGDAVGAHGAGATTQVIGVSGHARNADVNVGVYGGASFIGGTNTVTDMIGVQGAAGGNLLSSGTQTATNVAAFQSVLNIGEAGVTTNITNAYGLEVKASTEAGTVNVTNLYGAYIGNQSVGDTNYGLYVAHAASGTDYGIVVQDAEVYSLQLASTDGDAASGITFGTDTNLYRSAANTLRTDDDFYTGGNLTVAGTGASTVAGTLDVAGHLAFGNSATIDDTDAVAAVFGGSPVVHSVVSIDESYTGALADNAYVGTTSNVNLDPTANSSTTGIGVLNILSTQASNSYNLGLLVGATDYVVNNLDGDVTGVIGAAATVDNFGGGNVTASTAIQATSLHDGTGTVGQTSGLVVGVKNQSTGTITTARGINVDTATNSGGGTLATNYGIWVNTQTAGTNNYGLRVDSASTQTLWVSGDQADPTTAAYGIAFGSSRDTNLYRSAANTLMTDDSLYVATKAQIGSDAGTISQCNYLLGDQDCNAALEISRVGINEATNDTFGIYNYSGLAATSAVGVDNYAAYNDLELLNGGGGSYTGDQFGSYNRVDVWNATVTGDVYASYNLVTGNSGGSTKSVGVGIEVQGGGATVTGIGLEIKDDAFDAIDTNYGIYIEDLTGSMTADYGIAIAGADTQVLWLGSGADNTDAANGIAFGASRDTNLYRSAADVLRTDDALSVGTIAAADTDSYVVCRDASTGQLSYCDANTSGDPFINGGNTFGAVGVLGTNDAYGLSFETSNTVRASFAPSANTLYLGNADPATGTAASPNAFTIQGTGSATAATAGGAITIQSGTGNTTGAGGALSLTGGTGGATGAGGAVTISGGNGGASGGAGGALTLQAGNNITGGAGGAVNIFSGGGLVAGAINLQTANFFGTYGQTNIAYNGGNVSIGSNVASDAKLDVILNSTNTTADTLKGIESTVTDTGVVNSGTDTTYGGRISVTRTGATGGTINTYGLDIQATGDTGGTSTLTGLNVNVSGADTNYAAIFQGGNVGIGDTTPTEATLTVAGSFDASGHVAIGANATTDYINNSAIYNCVLGLCTISAEATNNVLGVEENFTDLNATPDKINVGIQSTVRLSPTADSSSAWSYGSASYIEVNSANTYALGAVVGSSAYSRLQGTGNVSFHAGNIFDADNNATSGTVSVGAGAYGGYVIRGGGSTTSALGVAGQVSLAAGSTGNITSAIAINANIDDSGTGSITNATGLFVDTLPGSTNNYGVYITANVTAATDYGVYIADAGDYSLYLASTDYDAASGITFAGNTNLYASAANTLKTDDNFIIGGATTFGTQTTSQTCGSNCTITQGNVDSYSAVLIDATAASLIVSMPDPTVTTAGKVVYVTAVDGSNDFTLRLNSGGTLVDISMKENTTATLIWNGSDWTAAGASSSTDLQAAYNNTLTSAGGAELVLNAAGGNADGLTIRNNSTTPITGALLEVQTSVGSNLFSVNNNATEYADNGGAESSTFTMWTATPDGGTITRYTTAGNYVATGQASTSVVTAATANQGVRNTLTSTLTPNLKYSVSFAVRGTANFNTLDVVYSRDGTNTSTTSCATGQTVTTGKWSRIICTFTAPSSGITSSNAIFIRQSDATAHTFYVDNLSVNVSADVNHAADGSVDSALGSNWTAFGTLDNLTRDTSVIYDTSGAVNVDTPNNADRGVRNNLSITPSTDTQYLVTFYTRSSNTFNDIRVRYSRDGGTSFVSCTDYNTQSVSTSTWTKITCLFTTDSTTATNADLIIDQPTASDRNFYIDALSVTLNQNTANNVQIGGGNEGGPATLLTLDRSAGAPIAENNDAYLGSMYYDTTTGRIQCYEADGWGACGAAPDNIVNLNPEYAGAVLNGSGVGTMTTDFCSNDTALSVNTSLCSTGEAKNFYKWTSPQATQQTYSIYVTYQLPATFKGFASDDTVQLVGRVDNTTNAAVTYEMFKSTGSAVTQCGTGETDVIAGGGGSADTWYSYGINGNESTGCSFTSSSAGNFVIFKINLKANSNASAYVSTLSFTSTGQ